MKNFLLSTLALTLVFFSFSCNKENDTVKSKTELLTQKAWMIEKYEEKVGSNAWVDEFPGTDACTKDDQYIFRANNTYEFNEGATKCDAADPQVFGSGNWSFKENETVLSLDSEDFKLDRLDGTNLVISAEETIGGTLYQIRITFRH
ncbi:MAG TPA: lipocalin family protein [Phnomibacter sp.]|nr:lipocalin family protein [Phnomibacter sp.]